MKPAYFVRGIFLLPLFLSMGLSGQQKISVDLGIIRQKAYHNIGVTFSGLYHFNEHFLGGMEVNRFIPVHRVIRDEEELLSGWDIGLNIHYLLSLSKHWKFFPITGFNHTSEKEITESTNISRYERYWSVITGAGILFESGKWQPFAEYNFTWGRLNQQYLLFGIGYEIDWRRHLQDPGSH